MKCTINNKNEIISFWDNDSNAPIDSLSCDKTYSINAFIDDDGNLNYCYKLVDGKVLETEKGSEYKLSELRKERNIKLTETDWTQYRDVTLSNDTDWKTYRQELRDITKTYKSIDIVKWPTKPE